MNSRTNEKQQAHSSQAKDPLARRLIGDVWQYDDPRSGVAALVILARFKGISLPEIDTKIEEFRKNAHREAASEFLHERANLIDHCLQRNWRAAKTSVLYFANCLGLLNRVESTKSRLASAKKKVEADRDHEKYLQLQAIKNRKGHALWSDAQCIAALQKANAQADGNLKRGYSTKNLYRILDKYKK